jgi:hypothetical protein
MPPPLGPLVSIVGPNDTEDRGFWVLVPNGYDPNKPGGYKVIYEAAGADDPDIYNAGKDTYQYQTVDGGDAIQVGLDYDTRSTYPLSYDQRNPESNDFAFMPWLMSWTESHLCVDFNHQFVSGFAEGAWVAQQFNCAFPGKLRGQVSVSGGEPTEQPTCDPAPTALFHIHDLGDASDTYASFLPGCARVLKQNGCAVTDCTDPMDTTVTDPYILPEGLAVPTSTSCRQFKGCPADAPVVFCTTHLPSTADRHSTERDWAVPAFWAFMKSLP